MSLPYDPYKPPAASLDGPRATDPSSTIPASVLEILARTRPWTKFMSIMMFILTGLMVLGGLAVLAMPIERKQVAAIVPAAILLLLYLPPALFLWRYSAQVQELQRGGGIAALEEALTAQKSFWKYVGILMIVVLSIYAVIIAGAAVFGSLFMRH
jgi:hypothetical protein